jgi:hypothetical protein
MKPESASLPRRRAWLALLVGAIALIGLFFASIVVEPTLIALAMEPITAEPGSGASAWANSGVWLVAIGACCLALLAIGYIAKKLSPVGSWVAPITLLIVVSAYSFFAQFPVTQSLLRIYLWAIALPASLLIGAWLAFRVQKTPSPEQAD